jgi:hypothetical protein
MIPPEELFLREIPPQERGIVISLGIPLVYTRLFRLERANLTNVRFLGA